jgi:hypothetical protein
MIASCTSTGHKLIAGGRNGMNKMQGASMHVKGIVCIPAHASELPVHLAVIHELVFCWQPAVAAGKGTPLNGYLLLQARQVPCMHVR